MIFGGFHEGLIFPEKKLEKLIRFVVSICFDFSDREFGPPGGPEPRSIAEFYYIVPYVWAPLPKKCRPETQPEHVPYCQNINFGILRSRAAFVFVAPAKIIISKHHLRKSRQFSPPPCRFQPVQNLRDLRKRVRSRKTSEKLDQKTKETREERPRDGAGKAEGGGGRTARLLLQST